jgi:uncharacterized membrane protein (UPF0127 family)
MTRALVLVALLGLLALACERGEPAPPPAEARPPHARVTIGVHVIDAEVADTPERKQRGLSGRASLADGHGMLFPYDAPARHGFWMPDMHFDIDILWIRAGRIVTIAADVSKDEPERVYRPSEPADMVLELPAGTAARRGFQVGDAVAVDD